MDGLLAVRPVAAVFVAGLLAGFTAAFASAATAALVAGSLILGGHHRRIRREGRGPGRPRRRLAARRGRMGLLSNGMIARLLAGLIVVGHLSFIGFVVAGGPLARLMPRLAKWHLGAIVVTVVINLTGSDCPLTVWEKHFLRQAGEEPYESGFISHYLVEPVYPAGIDGRVNLLLLAAWMIPTAFAYYGCGRRASRTRLEG